MASERDGSHPTPSYIRDEVETLPAREIERLQVERLRAGVERIASSVPFYRDSLAKRGLAAASIRSRDDLARLPFTTKEDLRDHYPVGLCARPLESIVRLHASSGTTGKPTVVAYTKNDIHLWSQLMARTLAAGGVTSEDVVQNAYGYGLFTGGLGVHYGAERIGATVIPASGGNTRRQLMLMQDLGSTALCCTPSYALVLAELAEETGIDVRALPLHVGLFGAEPWSEGMRTEIEQRLGILALDIYGLSEVMGPGIAFECPEKIGLHVSEDHFIPEIVDPDTGDPLPDGELGELVFTCPTKEALPLIRYRTRDRARLIREPCPCGRTTVRMDRVLGRTDDMIIVRGVNVFPSQVESALLEVEGIEPHYQIVVDRGERHLDRLRVRVEASEEVASDPQRREQLERQLVGATETALGISCTVQVVGPKEIQRSEGKAIRVVDNRQL